MTKFFIQLIYRYLFRQVALAWMCFLASLQSTAIAYSPKKILLLGSWINILKLLPVNTWNAVLFFLWLFSYCVACNFGLDPFIFVTGNSTSCVILRSSLGNFYERSPLLFNVQSSMHGYCRHFLCYSSTWGFINWKVISFPLSFSSCLTFMTWNLAVTDVRGECNGIITFKRTTKGLLRFKFCPNLDIF